MVDQAGDRAGERAGTLRTLDRGLAVLELIAEQEDGLSAKAVSEQSGVGLATCYQILRTLEIRDYLMRRDGAYVLGHKAAVLGDRYATLVKPPAEILSVLRELRDATEESCYLTVKQGHGLPIAAFLEGTQPLRVGALEVGYSAYPHARATGKCFLAYTRASLRDAFLPEELEARTRHTIVDRDKLDEDLEVIRDRGVAIEIEEFAPGVACVAAVVVMRDGSPFGAFGISMPVSRFPLSQESLIQRVKTAGETASRVLGFTGKYPPRSVGG